VLLAPFDLILLDRMLPDGDSLSLVRALRAAHPSIPIIVLSACGEVADRVSSLDEGADDYLVKPFALDEMLARIRAVRRRPAHMAGEEIRAGSLAYDLRTTRCRSKERRSSSPGASCERWRP
jgi:DNA-binding response OmpR family regulator